MSRNTKQTDLARQIEASLPHNIGSTSRYLMIHLGLRDRKNAILGEIEELKRQKATDNIKALREEKDEIEHDLDYYGQKLIAAGIDLDAPDTEMVQQATIVDNMKIVAEIVDILVGKGKPNLEGRPKQKYAYKKCISGTNKVSRATKQLCEEDLADYNLPPDAKQVQKMIYGITERQKKAQKAKKSYRCRDGAKQSLKAGYKAERLTLLAKEELSEEATNNETISPSQESEPSTTVQAKYNGMSDADKSFYMNMFGLAANA